jgi:hypothetical protein
VSLGPNGGENNKNGSIFEHKNQGVKEEIVNFDTEK